MQNPVKVELLLKAELFSIRHAVFDKDFRQRLPYFTDLVEGINFLNDWFSWNLYMQKVRYIVEILLLFEVLFMEIKH